MSQYIFGQPYTYKDWYIFPNTTLDNLRINDCPSSVTGTCEDTKTIEDCIQLCKDNQPCFAGYFIETPDKKNICVPIRKISEGLAIGPYYRLRNQNIYPELEGMKSYVFTSQKYNYPPDHGNSIFYTDKFVLTNITSQKSVGVSDEGKISINKTLTTKPVYVQFLPREILRSYVTQYIAVKNGDEVVINIPDTAYILKDDSENISWVLGISSLEGPNNTFRVFSADKNKKIGDFLNYQDTLYFTIQGRLVIYDMDNNRLKTISTSLENVMEKSNNMFFKTSPKIHVYYCENGECKSIMLDQTEMNQEKARYKGITISRSPSCWGCRANIKRGVWWIYILVVLGIIAAIFLVVFRKK